MMKNDITYEYRVFTHRLIDLESMEVGICTSKVIKEIKPKDKVNGRFFHTSDTDEWYFCWNGELQKLNLKGNSDVNAALAEVEKLIADANAAVEDAKKTATDAKKAAAEAKTAADAASAAVESIEGKADKSAVDAVEKAVELKADKSEVEALAESIPTVPTNVSAFKNDAGYLTSHQDISGKQDVIADLATIRANAELGATAIQEIPDTYATKEYVGQQIDAINLPTVPTNVSEFINDAGYLTKDVADGYYAALGTTGSGDGVSKEYVDTELAKKQNIIDDLDNIRTKANSALQSIPDEYVTNEELEGKGYLTAHQDISGKQDVINDLDNIRSGAALGATALQAIPEEYITEDELAAKGYLTADVADLKYAPIGSASDGSGNYATQDFVRSEISKINIPTVPTNVSAFTNDAGYLTEHQDISGKQDVIDDLEDIRANAELAKTALQAIPEEYVTEDELAAKGYLTEHQSLDNYYTKKEIDDKIDAINTLIGQAIDITNTILNA